MSDSRASRAVTIEKLIRKWRRFAVEADRFGESDVAPAVRECADELEALLADVLGSPLPEKDEGNEICTRCGHVRSAHGLNGLPCLGWMPRGTGHHDDDCRCAGFQLTASAEVGSQPPAGGKVMEERHQPVPVPLGDGRHDIGDDVRAAIVERLTADWSRDPELTPEKARQLAMWAGASVRALLHELGTLNDLAASAEVCSQPPQEDELQRLRRALVTCLIPLEGLHAAVEWELAPEVKATIANAVTVGRAAMSASAEGSIPSPTESTK